MYLTTRNVNTAFRELVSFFHDGGKSIVRKQSRNGDVLMIDEPVTVTYTHSRERLLFNQARDCNPFFHVYEALWMLAGRNDVAPLAYYSQNMTNYSDDSKTLNGAYGYRWRKASADTGYRLPGDEDSRSDPRTEVDQLDIIVQHLKSDPTSRRAVLQMWNVEDDLLKIDTTKDNCCNLSVMFSLREVNPAHAAIASLNELGQPKVIHGALQAALIAKGNEYPLRYLDMTVTNRSNDMIWGMLGANYVHFSFLQEYMAARLGVEVGKYHHFTNNLHVYESNWKPEEWLAECLTDKECYYHSKEAMEWKGGMVPLVKDPAVFEEELRRFVEFNSKQVSNGSWSWKEPFFETMQWMLNAFHLHKARDYKSALTSCSFIKADDWRIAATNWIKKRQLNWESKNAIQDRSGRST